VSRPLQTQPLSVFLGLVIGALLLVTMGQMPTNILDHQRVRVECGPHPREFVQLRGGTPFVVPSGQIFVLTALGRIAGNASTYLRINGNNELIMYAANAMSDVPTGFTVSAGNVIELADQFGNIEARAWGYLAQSQ
jgi:hypothetical protein